MEQIIKQVKEFHSSKRCFYPKEIAIDGVISIIRKNPYLLTDVGEMEVNDGNHRGIDLLWRDTEFSARSPYHQKFYSVEINHSGIIHIVGQLSRYKGIKEFRACITIDIFDVDNIDTSKFMIEDIKNIYKLSI